jgi:signal peptide peptidase SppA
MNDNHPLAEMASAAILRRLLTDVPMLQEGALNAFVRRAGIVGDPKLAEHPGLKDFRQRLAPQVERLGDVAVVPIVGALARRPDPFEMAWGDVEDTDAIRGLVERVGSDPDVSGILLDIDSPGGFYGGGPEMADAVKNAARRKPVVAYTGGMMASLAYLVGSQANQVVASRSATVGSIGVWTAIIDVSKLYESMGVKVELFRNKEGTFKAAGMPGTSLTDEQRAHIQGRTDALFGEFRRAVRGARVDVPDEAMRGQTFYGAEAKAQGLIDRVGDRSFALSALRSLIRERNRS